MPDERDASRPAEDDPQIKVTDRRMFTPDGRLRDEYQFLDRPQSADAESADAGPADAGLTEPARPAAADSPAPTAAAPPPRPPAGAPAAPEPPGSAAPSAPPPGADESPPERPRRPEIPGFSGPASVGLLDLVAMLAESAAVYLGDAELPDGSSGEQLEMARVHIDLLEVLRQKTAGNLSSQESAVLEDVLYRLRVRYVQKRG